MIMLTNENKLWKFPIDNEQGKFIIIISFDSLKYFFI
jgi:hypothetical protein